MNTNTLTTAVTAAVLSAPADCSIFLNAEAMEVASKSLGLVENYGYDWFSDVAERNIYVLETPGAACVLVFPDSAIKWGQRDSDGIAWTAEDVQVLNLLGGEWFISIAS